MRKLFFVIGFLILFIASFGREMEKEKISNETTVNIRAEVVNAASISTDYMDFGVIFPGEKDKSEIKEGEILIKGTPLRGVHIQVKDSSGKWINHTLSLENSNIVRKEYKVILKNTKQGSKDTMEAKLTLFGEGFFDESILLGGKYTLSLDGKIGFKVRGKLTAKSSQDSGNYKGYLYVREKYTLDWGK